MKGTSPRLRDIEGIRPIYFVPRENIAEEVLIPCLENAVTVDCMVGFFSGESFSILAPGLASFISVSSEPLKLIISPVLRAEDREAISAGCTSPEDVIREFLAAGLTVENALSRHTLRCLAYLISVKRLQVQIALLKDAIFHPKVWLISDGTDTVAVHGSSNLTVTGLSKNFEQVSVTKSWSDGNSSFVVERLRSEFNSIWCGRSSDCQVFDFPEAVSRKLLREYSGDQPPTEDELFAIMENEPEDKIIVASGNAFGIPPHLNYRTGDYAHQGRAADAFEANEFRGVLEMATGSGKTITAMICAHKLYQERQPLLVVVAAPYVPLIQQWCSEITPFGIKPVNLTEASGVRGRAREINRIKRRLRTCSGNVEAVVVSHKTLCDDAFKVELQGFDCATFLIADEVHNLGSEGFTTAPPSFFNYRLGLSATPVRQYDDEGTAALFSFFGPIVFRFTLKEAIGRCLVEYDYYVHPVELTPDEMDEWYDLTSKIKANAWRQEDGRPDPYLAKLFRDRRLILETARNKIAALDTALAQEDPLSVRHTLIYASDKAPQQLVEVNALVKARGLLFHQLTYQETASREQTARIIRSFQEGTLRVLTAKRVLDEGVNIPQIEKAFILASTTVERQWIQRRGRLLRTCREIGKTHSEIHDFLALPPDIDNVDDEARTLIRSELLRSQEFASLARNAGRDDGPLSIIHRLVVAAFK